MLAKTPKKQRAPRKKTAAPKEPSFTIDIAGTDEDSFRDVFDLLLAEHAEAGIGPLNAEKAAEVCYRTLEQGMTLIARDRKGKAIGTMGIITQTFWYSDLPHLRDAWLYVSPKNRRNTVGKMLLKAARAIADANEKLLFVTISNPNRQAKKKLFGPFAQEAGYIPIGYTSRIA